MYQLKVALTLASAFVIVLIGLSVASASVVQPQQPAGGLQERVTAPTCKT